MTTATIATLASFECPAAREADVAEAIDRLAKRARRLGVGEPTYRVVRRFDKEERHWSLDDRGRMAAGLNPIGPPRITTEPMVEVAVEGDEVRLDGWRLVARAEHHGEAGDVLYRSPAHPDADLARFRGRGPVCDHCKRARRRKDTFIVGDEDGQLLQVGRTCIADFLGHGDPTALAKRAAWPFEVLRAFSDEEGGCFGRSPTAFAIGRFLAFVAACERVDGFVTSTAARERGDFVEPTGSRAWGLMLKESIGWNCHGGDRLRETYTPTDRDAIRARRTLRWIERLDGRSDYEANLQTVVRTGAVTLKQANLAASALLCWSRDVEKRLARRRARRSGTASRHLGEPKKRMIFADLTVEMIRYISGDYGTTTLYKFADPEGNVLAYFASRDLRISIDEGLDEDRAIEQGDRVTLKATVKKHDVYREAKQTVITRAVVQEDR